MAEGRYRVRGAVPGDVEVMAQMQLRMAKETENLDLDPGTVRRGMQIPFEQANVARFFVVEEDGEAGATAPGGHGAYSSPTSAEGAAGGVAQPPLEAVDRRGRVVAMMMVTTEWSEWRAGFIYWIQSVYVLPECRRRGLFRMLYRFLQADVARDPDAQGIRLYVEHHNATAMKTYESLGMSAEHYTLMKWMKGSF